MREVLRQAMRGDLPTARGERPRILITATADTLRTGAGFGRTATGEDLPAATIRRMACDADVLGLVMTSLGAPLKLGRRRRTVSPTQWIALVARDTGCVLPGCSRPAEYCDAHHVVHWLDGGPTDLDNLALLCGHHHDQIHHRGWDIGIGEDRRPWLRPPSWINTERPALRNTYWDTQQAIRNASNADNRAARSF